MIDVFDGNNTVFWSDTHFGHENIILFCQRPFKSVGEMNYKLLSEFRKADEEGKTIIHLGDFTFNASFVTNCGWRPKGKHYIFLGNHDKNAVEGGKYRKLYREFFDIIWSDVKSWKTDSKVIYVDGTPILLSHEPQKFDNKTGFCRYNLFGHHHNNIQTDPERYVGEYDWLFVSDRHHNISVENTEYRPMTLAEILARPAAIQK
jgi:calcineurin-like phosphoesterase family protein